jgi:hypothetical protein
MRGEGWRRMRSCGGVGVGVRVRVYEQSESKGRGSDDWGAYRECLTGTQVLYW